LGNTPQKIDLIHLRDYRFCLSFSLNKIMEHFLLNYIKRTGFIALAVSMGLMSQAGARATDSIVEDAPVVGIVRVYDLAASGKPIPRPDVQWLAGARQIQIGNDAESKALELTLAEAASAPVPIVTEVHPGDGLNVNQDTTIGWERPDGDTRDLSVFVELIGDTGETLYTSARLGTARVLRVESSPLVLPPGTLRAGQTLKVRVTFFKKTEDIVFKGIPVSIGTASRAEMTVHTVEYAQTRARADQLLETGGGAATSGGVLQLKPKTYSVREAAKSANIVISRTGGSADGANVSFQTEDGTALAGRDYVATNGTVLFKKGEGAKTIPVSLIDNTRVDGARTFQFKLVAADGGATLSTNSSATITITDNDTGGKIAFSTAKFTTNESASAAVITLKRVGGTASAVSVDYWTVDGTAVAGRDYSLSRGTVTFDSRETVKTFTVPLKDNADASADRVLNLRIGNFKGGGLAGALTNATLTLVNDDSVVNFTTNSVTGTEGGGITLTITRTGNLTKAESVTVATLAGTATAGTDFASTNLTVTFPAKTATRTVTIPLLNDASSDAGETFRVVLRNPTGALRLGSVADVTVKINDAPDPDAIPAKGAAFFKFTVDKSSFTSTPDAVVGSYNAQSHFLVVSGTQIGKSLGSKTHMMLIQNFSVTQPGTYRVPSPTYAAVSYQRITTSTTPTEPDFFTTLEGQGGGTIMLDVLDTSAKIATGRFDVTLPNAKGTGSVHITGSFRVPLK
jgi:hypothetical protein